MAAALRHRRGIMAFCLRAATYQNSTHIRFQAVSWRGRSDLIKMLLSDGNGLCLFAKDSSEQHLATSHERNSGANSHW